MKHTDKEVKEYLLWWVLNLGQGMIHVEDVDWIDAERTYSIFKLCQRRKFIRVRETKDSEEEDQFPGDITSKHRWGSYYRITKKGRKYATL
jgi:hypothetical protein